MPETHETNGLSEATYETMALLSPRRVDFHHKGVAANPGIEIVATINVIAKMESIADKESVTKKSGLPVHTIRLQSARKVIHY